MQIYSANSCFTITPYAVHALQTLGPTSLLTICLRQGFTVDKVAYALQNFFAQVLPAGLAQKQEQLLLKELLTANEWDWQTELNKKNFNLQASLSKFHFIRKYKKTAGLTPHRLQVQNRLRAAQRLLEKQLDITEVALASGFYDQSHFSKAFKNLYNVTPAFYQKHCLVE